MPGTDQMHSSQSESERVRTLTGEAPSFRGGVHFFAVNEGAGPKRQLTFGVSIPWIAEAYRSIAAVLFCAIALVPSLLWAVRDRRVWPWDQAWYGEVSVDLWWVLTHAPTWWYRLMKEALGLKPPAVVWLGQFFVPLREVFGSVEAALLFSVLLTQLAVLILIYRISVNLTPDSRGSGFIGVAAAAGAQQFVGLSHQMFAEPLQCLAVAWTLLVAFRCDEWPRARTLIHLAASALLGILAKASTPVYTLIPMAFIVLRLARSQQPWDFRAEWRRRASRALGYGLIVEGAFGAIWYAKNYAAVLEHVRYSSSSDFGFRASVASKFLLWLGLWRHAFLDPYLAWILGLLVLASGAIVLARVPFSRWRRPLLVGFLSVAQIAVVLFVFALNDAVETRYLYALLPYVAIMLVALWSVTRYRAVQALVMVACLAQWATVNLASFEPMPVLAKQDPWLLPIVTAPTSYRELSEVIRRTSVFQGYNIVAIEESSLNSNSAAFFAAKNRLSTGIRSQYTSIGYGQKDTSAAMKRIEEFSTRFVITLDEPFQVATPNYLNLVTLPVLRELNSSERFARVPFPSEKGILIFERQDRASAATRP